MSRFAAGPSPRLAPTGGIPPWRAVVVLALLVAASGCTSLSLPPPDGSAADRETTLASLLRMEDRRWYDPVVAGRACASPDPYLRARVALAAGRLKDPEASALLPVLLRDGEPSVREAAAFGAGLSGDVRLVRVLVPLIDAPPLPVAEAAAEALGKLATPEARSALVACVLAKWGGPRAACARSLWRGPDEEARAALRRAAASTDGPVRSAAVYALARRPDPSSAPLLRGALAPAPQDGRDGRHGRDGRDGRDSRSDAAATDGTGDTGDTARHCATREILPQMNLSIKNMVMQGVDRITIDPNICHVNLVFVDCAILPKTCLNGLPAE